MAEILCEHTAHDFGLSTVCLRIANPIEPDDAAWKQRPIRPQWIAFPDLVEAYRLALAAADVRFEVITIVGESSRRRWDLSKAELRLGYRPKYRLEDLGFTLGDEASPAMVFSR